MNNQYQQPDYELGWEDELTVDQEELVTLRPGEYIFTIIGFERKRYEPKPGSTGKLPSCNMAEITIEINDPEQGRGIARNNLYLHSSTQGLLSAFFASIGMKKKGEPAKMNWAQVLGKQGVVKIKNREYNGNKYNDVDRFLPLDASYYQGKELPPLVAQLQQPMTYGQQPVQTQPQQQQGYQQPNQQGVYQQQQSTQPQQPNHTWQAGQF